MKARKGSTHGYDIVDHTKLNPELGGEEGFERLSQALKAHDLGLILDFVPNHVGVHFADNPWWLDVLEWGPASPHAASFDIDWDILPYRARAGVLLPIIGSSYGEALEKGEIELRYDPGEGSFSAWYFEHRLPIAPERYGEILRNIVREAGAEDSDAGKRILELASRYKGLRHPNRKEAPAFKAELQDIAGSAEIIARGLDAYPGRAGPACPDARAASPAGAPALPARTLAACLQRHQLSAVLRHQYAGGIAGRGCRHVRGHPSAGQETDRGRQTAGPAARPHRRPARSRAIFPAPAPPDPGCAGPRCQPFYMVIEKILGEHEKLLAFSGVHGTTGYEWLNAITQVLVDGKGLEPLDEVWRQISNQPPRLAPVLKDAKRRVLETLLTSEFTVLSRLLARIAGGHYSTRDFSADSLRQALELYVLHFPVYRTYLTPAGPTAHDRALIAETIEKARAEWFAADDGIFDFLRDALTMDLIKPGRASHSAPRVRRFALKLQQFTGPMMAKSLEDTDVLSLSPPARAQRGRRRSRQRKRFRSMPFTTP